MLTHVDNKNRPQMVDVSEKEESLRVARAQSHVKLSKEIMDLLKDGDINTKKGPVFHTAIIAGTMAAKKTSDLIPFCHPIMVESCKIKIRALDETTVGIECLVKTHNKTGIEMEALCGASIAALTIYDMCKAMSHEIEIGETYLLEKTGGKSDYKK